LKRILCYGDSNTWGAASFDGRIDGKSQWPIILQSFLGKEYIIAQEGLCGRVAGDFDTHKPYRNGKTSYEVILRSVEPSAIIIALGTNDLKAHYKRSAQQITDDLLWYTSFTQELAKNRSQPVPQIIYLLPANFESNEYFTGSKTLRLEVVDRMKNSGVAYIELNDLEMTEDGVHYSLKAHKEVAHLVDTRLQKEKFDE
jgi:lysophospholipase L1-like esterase